MENTKPNAARFIDEWNLSKIGKPQSDIEDVLIAYANSVRPEVVVPSEDFLINLMLRKVPVQHEGSARKAFMETISELRRLNPTLTFTELNNEK